MRRLRTGLLSLAALLASCTQEGEILYRPTPGEEQPAGTPLVTVIYDPNGMGDRSYNDLIYQGVESAAKRYGVRTLQLSPETEAQGRAYLETMFTQMENATDTVRRLFITPSLVFDDYIRGNNRRLESNPYADLLYLETTTPLEGKGSTLYVDYYGAMYMSGCMAQYVAKDVVALLLANPTTPTVCEAGSGFEDGFNDTQPLNPAKPLALHVRYLSDKPVGGFTIADSTATRIFKEELYSLYTDKINHVTLVPVCGGSMHAFFRAAKSYVSSMNYVGVDADMTADKDYCVFSTLKHIDKVILDYIGMWLNHSMPKHKRMGFADGLTDVVLGNYTYNTSLSQLNVDSLRQVAIRKEGERYAK